MPWPSGKRVRPAAGFLSVVLRKFGHVAFLVRRRGRITQPSSVAHVMLVDIQWLDVITSDVWTHVRLHETTRVHIASSRTSHISRPGSAVVAFNMKESDTNSAINTMVDGQYMDGIFGFCDIRNFTDATEILQDGVMLFVNQVSSFSNESLPAILEMWCGVDGLGLGSLYAVRDKNCLTALIAEVVCGYPCWW